MSTRVVGTGIIGVALVVGIAWAGGDWSTAQHKADDFKSKQKDLQRAAVEATKKIVSAVCEADEESRTDAGRSATSSYGDGVKSKESDLKNLRDEVYKLIDGVMSDDKLKNDHSDASRLKSDIGRQWDTISQMTKGFHESSYPAIEKIVKAGNSAHHDHLDRCDVKGVDVGSKRAECLNASGETCTVTEIAPDNSKGIRKANDRAKDIARSLNDELGKKESSTLKHLIDNKSAFGKCKKFEAKVECYKICPEVNDNAEVRDPSSPSWRSSCS